MSNLRVIYDNAADRATLTSSATATVANLGVANLLSDVKSLVCRSTGKTLAISVVFPTAENIDGVVLAFTNCSPTTTIRVRTTTSTTVANNLKVAANAASWGTYSYAYDTTAVLGCPAPSVKIRKWTAAQAASAYAYGGGADIRVWFPTKSVLGMLIEINDTNNLQGYVECSRLIVGGYWEPEIGVDIDSTMTLVDTTKQSRTEAGDLIVEAGTRHKKLSLNMPSLSPTDSAKMWEILWTNGLSCPFYVSVFPNHSNATLEAKYQGYVQLVETPVMSTPYFNYQAAKLELESV